MPYPTLASLPPAVKKLPKGAQEIYQSAFNSAYKTYKGEEHKAHAVAWTAVEKSYKKKPDGTWVEREAVHPHGEHVCICSKCDAKVTVEAEVKCNTQECPKCGGPMVAETAGEKRGEVKEAMSANDKRELLQVAVIDSLAIGNREQGPWIRDIYPDSLVYEIAGKMYQVAYVIDSKGRVVFGEADRVTPSTVYTPVQEAVEAKIEELSDLTSERGDEGGEAKEAIDNLLELMERKDLTEEIAKPFIDKADAIITKLEEAAPMKTEDGQQYPRSAFAYAPEADKPATWKLRLWEDPVKKITKAQLGRAAAALSPGGFRGNKVDVDKEALPAIKTRIRAEYKKLAVEPESMPKWVREADESRARVFESCEIDITEVTKGGLAQGIVPVRIIKPGFNTSKTRFYAEGAIQDAADIFEGTKMYADHPTKEEDEQRPERSIKDWVATLHNTRVAETGNAVGDAHINAGWLKEKIVTLFEQGDLQHLGTSINAVGKTTNQVIEGIKTILVEGLVRTGMQSVDFVTEAGAGGQAGLRESGNDAFIDADLMDIATLREARPDLVEVIESNIREEIQLEVRKTMEDKEKIVELEGTVETLTTENTTLKEEKVQAEKDKAKAEAQTAIKDAVEKAELPEAAKTRLLEAHKDDESAEGIEEAITAEATYVATLTDKGNIKGLGPSAETDPKTEEKLDEAINELSGVQPKKKD